MISLIFFYLNYKYHILLDLLKHFHLIYQFLSVVLLLFHLLLSYIVFLIFVHIGKILHKLN